MNNRAEDVAFSLIDLSLRVREVLKRKNRSTSLQIELLKIILICDPIHLYTRWASDWLPPSTNIEHPHRKENSGERIKFLLGEIRRGIDELARIVLEKNLLASLKTFREVSEHSLVKIRCRLLDEEQGDPAEQLSDYYVGLGRLLIKLNAKRSWTKHFEDCRLKLEALGKAKGNEHIFVSSPPAISVKSFFRSASTDEEKLLSSSRQLDRSTCDDLIVDAEEFFHDEEKFDR